MSYIPTLAEAEALMAEHNKEDFHRRHAKTVSAVMGEFAKKYDPENIEFWEAVGMLHDLDFEEFPDLHCVKEEEMLKALDVDPGMIHAICAHGFGVTKIPYGPESEMEKILFACDELTGLIWACSLMRPSKSVQDMELKSLKKKFKDKSFAAGCSRDIIKQGAEQLGWTLERLMDETLQAMKAAEAEINA